MRCFAVVEDDTADASLISDYIVRISEEHGEEASVLKFTSSEDFFACASHFDAVFLDINLPGMDGLTCAKKIRESDHSVILVFITSLSQFAIRGYEVDALDYVLKPVIYTDFQQKLARIFKRLDNRPTQRYTITLPDSVLYISLDDLMYIEVTGHTLAFHLRDRVVKQYGKLADVEKVITPLGFIRCNRCYIVNPRYVEEVCGYMVTVGGDKLTVSRSMKQPFLRALNAWMAKEGG